MPEYRIYKVFAISRCGSYFQSYLKTMTVIAESPEGAMEMAKAFAEKEGFILAKPPEQWEIVELGPLEFGVIDYLHDSDY